MSNEISFCGRFCALLCFNTVVKMCFIFLVDEAVACIHVSFKLLFISGDYTELTKLTNFFFLQIITDKQDYSGNVSFNRRHINMEAVSCWRVYACVAYHSYITLKSLSPNEILLWESHFFGIPDSCMTCNC